VAVDKLTYLYDGSCTVCTVEVERLRRRDAGSQALRLVDISQSSFDPGAYGRSLSDLMHRVHAVSGDGRVLVGMDAVRAAYAAVGLGWLLAPTRWPGLRPLFDRLYLWFAGNRQRISAFAGRWGYGTSAGAAARPAPDVVGFYTATDGDYGAWSADFNMHFGFYERGLNPLDREAMLERMNAKVHERLALGAGPARVADLGCGTGATARSLLRRRSDTRVSAVTIVPSQVERGRDRSVRAGFGDAIAFVLRDYADTGLDGGAYDGAYAIESACHAPGTGKRGLIDEAFRLLRPGATLVIADCFVKRPGALPWPMERAYRRWCESWAVPDMPRLDAMRDALHGAGFVDLEFTEISWNVAPSIAHVPWVAGRFLVVELWRGRGRLSDWRRRHFVASVLSIFLGLCRGWFGYYLVSARKPL
jgi:MPBQ/MSBQ methyltransferase